MPVVLTLPDAMHLAAETEPSWGLRTRFALALRLARGADAAITPSAFSRGELIRRAGFPRERLHVVPQGTPPLSPPCTERPAAIPERPFALVVGANRVHKNHRLLAHVWQLLGAPPALDLVAVGALDPRFPSLDALARETGARGVHVLGAVSPGTLAWAYTHATLLVFPSRYEGFGFPLLEAAAYGTPVLASDIPALRELGEGVARFVPANEPSANDATVWARAIADLAADDAARARMRDAGRDLAARHDYATVAARTLALLESVVGTRPR
jgi:glycosyltransferase involved in cell wall biosynthesis